MRIRRLDHVQLAMPPGGEEEAIAFYDGLLGIPHVPKPPHLAARGGCWFERGDLKVHLGVDPQFAPARKAHPAFLVADLDGLESTVTAAGHECVRSDGEIPGVERFHTFDPFGNRIEFQQA